MERISLTNSAFEGNNNVFLFDDGPETVLIDTGDGTSATRNQLTARLREREIELSDVDCLFLTHWHEDHTGLAGEIQAESGADVYVHQRDAPLVEGNPDAWSELRNLREQYFTEWGMPAEKQQGLHELLEAAESGGNPPTVATFEDGDIFSINEHELEVVCSPGHTDGLCIFEWHRDGKREIFSGDAILPVYTPNIGGADVRVERPLQKYLRSLRRIADADYERAWPGHRDPIDSPADRAEYIINHHEERAWRVLDVLRRLGPCDTWSVSAELFGNLESIHVLHGPGEAFAHLEHLERSGAISREGTTYRLRDDTADELEQLEGERWSVNH